MKKKQKTRLKRSHFLIAFATIVVALCIARCINPAITLPRLWDIPGLSEAEDAFRAPDSIAQHATYIDSLLLRRRTAPRLLRPDGKPVKNRVKSVPSLEESFPDLNDVQLATAQRLGISQIANREEAHKQLDRLVYIGDNPYYYVQPLHQSIPYLIPRAATLLAEISRAFNDSLATKGYPPHKLVVTSVLRTQQDVQRLRKHNSNASENSCHQFGTTFDITYNRFLEIKPDATDEIRWVTVFKSILAEVLNDQRELGTCYVKYERHQSCFHITAR